jgi:hypothetical protein
VGLATAIGSSPLTSGGAAFPELGDYRIFLDRMLGYVRKSSADLV